MSVAGGSASAAQTASDRSNGSLELTLMILASILALAAIALAAQLYLRRPGTADRVAERFPDLYRFLLNKGHVDEIYDEVIVQPVKALSEGVLWRGLDVTVIDGAVNGTGTIVAEAGAVARKAQTGSMRAYALSVLLGAVMIVGYCLWWR
jgi:NADH-quinone oxidoreductase subunit L